MTTYYEAYCEPFDNTDTGLFLTEEKATEAWWEENDTFTPEERERLAVLVREVNPDDEEVLEGLIYAVANGCQHEIQVCDILDALNRLDVPVVQDEPCYDRERGCTTWAYKSIVGDKVHQETDWRIKIYGDEVQVRKAEEEEI